MSMNATFVQVDGAELSHFTANPSLAESLFQGGSGMPQAFINLSKAMQERARAMGPEMLAGMLSRLDPALRQRLGERLGKSPDQLSEAFTGDDIARLPSRGSSSGPVLELDKAWHGVHYLLCGQAEPGETILSQAVLGGTALGDDDEGFSGYGPARYFTAAQVAELAQALSRNELELEAASRFDAPRMNEL